MIILKTAPISVNRLYRGRRFLTSDGKSIKEQMAWEIKKQWKDGMIIVPCSVDIKLYFKDNRRRDIDGVLKGLLDSMTGIVYEDDSLIVELTVKKQTDRESPRVEIIITT